MFNKVLKIIIAFVLMLGMVTYGTDSITEISANEVLEEEYLIYPKPQTMEYNLGSYIVSSEVNVIIDENVDKDTIVRLRETLSHKNIHLEISDDYIADMTNIYIGVLGSGGLAETFILDNYEITEGLFDKTDAYFLSSEDNIISVLGSDIDSSFYGVTTLYHIFAQMESLRLRNFIIEDYADIVSRGFIEGYYGNPWSTEDRVNLMEWGGYYKLNSYYYAPKDDAKHNAKWRELYTDEEIETKIKPLAEAGNRSKNRFVFALHPYMINPIRYNNEDNYQADLKVMQAKFKQVIDAGVRQISILADDANNVGGDNYIKTLVDMTKWLEEQQEIYPDLKLTLPFVTQEYMGWGESYFSQFPENVQVVMTGGRVWGEVSKDFTETFTNNVGRGPYMWINWPCTDNSKEHLIMGGYHEFLHSNITPGTVEGIVLNPMQQSEPSKVAIFGNAAYSWNMWESEEEADQAWEDSFSFVDHNDAIENPASNALKELSKHMINQNMDSRVLVLEESLELKKLLTPLRERLASGTLSTKDVELIDEIIAEFTILQDAAVTYRQSAGNSDMRDQMIYWLNSWDDTTEAAITYLEALKSIIIGDITETINLNGKAKVAFDKSRSHGFHYVDHIEYAEVGVQHIVPFIRDIQNYVSNIVEGNINPDALIQNFISNRQDTPVGDLENVFDNSDSTNISFRSPAVVKKDDFVGVSFNKTIEVNDIRFLLGTGKNHIDESKLQYTLDNETWLDIPLVNMENKFTAVRNQHLEVKVEKENLPENFKAKAIRLIATRDNSLDVWLEVHEITVNHEEKEQNFERITGEITSEGIGIRQGSLKDIQDGDYATEAMYAKDPYTGADRDSILENSTITVKFDSPQAVKTVKLVQGKSAPGDTLALAELQYQLADSKEWIIHSTLNSAIEQEKVLNIENIQSIRILNKQTISKWWRLGEIEIISMGSDSEKNIKNVYTNTEHEILSDSSNEGLIALESGIFELKRGEYVGVKLDNVLSVSNILVTNLSDDLVLESAIHPELWTTYEGKDVDAKYIRVRATKDTTFNLSEFKVTYDFISPYSVTSNFANSSPESDLRSGDNVNTVFDQNLQTGGTITGVQEKDKEIIFDLGQVREIDSLRYYIDENSYDYPRAVDFLVSESLDGTWSKIMHIGPEDNELIKNVSDTTTAKSYEGKYLTHDSRNPGMQYSEASDLKQTARFIKIVPTQTYSHRWLKINEIQINDGEFVNTEFTKDIISNSSPVNNQLLSSMIDKDYASSYKAAHENENLTYRISESDLHTVRIIQNGEISNATVSAKVFDKDHNLIDIKLGNLGQAINEFALSTDLQLVEVIVSWENIIPEIAEISLSNKAQTPTDVSKLEALINKPEDTKDWLLSSKETYDLAYAVGATILNSEYTTQNIIDSAIASIITATTNKLFKGDPVNLLSFIENERFKVVDNVTVYTTASFNDYAHVISKIKVLLENVDQLSVEQVESLELMHKKAVENLKFSLIESQLAQALLTKEMVLDADLYTVVSYDTYRAAKDVLESLIKDSNSNPVEVNTKAKTYTKSVEELVNVEKLKKLLELDFDQELYTDDSFAKYMLVKESVLGLLIDGTRASVSDGVNKLEIAIAGLVIKEDSGFEQVIKEFEAIKQDNYTINSYADLQAVIKQAKADLVKNEDALNQINLEKMKEANANLVDISELLPLIEKANSYSTEDFTSDSFNRLLEELEKVKTIVVSGSKDDVDAAIISLSDVMESLVVNAKDLAEYQKSVTLLDASLYTESTYQNYLTAYNRLMALEVNNTSIEEFLRVKELFETSILNLELIDVEVDYRNLSKAIENAKGYKQVDYTEASYQALLDAIKLAEQVLKDQNSTQTDVDTAIKVIDKAIKELKVKELPPIKDDENKEDETLKPPTGIKLNESLYLLVIVLGLSLIVIARKKKMNIK